MSNDGMLTTVWGPGMWHFLHTMSFNYPVHPTPRDRARYQRFLLSLQYILPCGKCRANLQKTMRTTLPLRPCHLVSRDALSRYVYTLHETVNGLLGKSSGLSYADVRERYEHFRARCLHDPGNDPSNNNDPGKDPGKEVGCVEPVYGTKAKCVLHIVPQDTPCPTLQIDRTCYKSKAQGKTKEKGSRRTRTKTRVKTKTRTRTKHV